VSYRKLEVRYWISGLWGPELSGNLGKLPGNIGFAVPGYRGMSYWGGGDEIFEDGGMLPGHGG
jgi:hypothetical protein